ncbi:MAG: Pepco domain-containing protein [Elainellaceae cyanobacterium]
MAEHYIWIVTDAVSTGDRGGDTPRSPFEDDVPTIPSSKRPGIPVPVEKLEQGMIDFLDTMGRVLKQAQAKAQDIGGMELDEIELSVEVNGEGQLSLLGSGTKVGGRGALTLKFKRAAASKPGE